MAGLKKSNSKTFIPSSLTNTFSLQTYATDKQGELVPTKKKRTYKRACRYCNKRHFSCDGKRPCENCINKKVECVDLIRKQKAKKDISIANDCTSILIKDNQNDSEKKVTDSKDNNNAPLLFEQQQKQPQVSKNNQQNIPSFSVNLDQDNVPQAIDILNENKNNLRESRNIETPHTIQTQFQNKNFQNNFEKTSTSTIGNFNKEVTNPYQNNQQDIEYTQQQIRTKPSDNSIFMRPNNNFYEESINNFQTSSIQPQVASDDVFSDSSSEDDYEEEKDINLSDDNNYYGNSFQRDIIKTKSESNLPTTEYILANEQAKQAIYERKQLKKKKKLQRLEICKYLGPKGYEVLIDPNIDLLHQHFPLVAIDQDNGDLFNQEQAFNNIADGNFNNNSNDIQNTNTNNLNKDNKVTKNQLTKGIDFRIINLEKKLLIPSSYSTTNNSNPKGISYILELPPLPDGESRIVSNPEWTHSLQYKKPSEIYSKITQPFLHTHGFTSLLEYIKKRFSKSDVIKICYDIAAIRPVFIASCINFQEEDMIFMEHCFQRTLLEYASFIEEVGNPTIVWRRTGQISYVNDEFLMLTGWTRQQLLGKMTFVIEILDDESSLIFFKNFKAVCYSDYTGFVNVPSMKVLTPKKGNYVECSSFFIVKRDTFGLPTFTVGNFLPK